jgi:hypothetical protein
MTPHSACLAQDLRALGYEPLKGENHSKQWLALNARSFLGIPQAVCPRPRYRPR